MIYYWEDLRDLIRTTEAIKKNTIKWFLKTQIPIALLNISKDVRKYNENKGPISTIIKILRIKGNA